jgi:hypothetical protein
MSLKELISNPSGRLSTSDTITFYLPGHVRDRHLVRLQPAAAGVDVYRLHRRLGGS